MRATSSIRDVFPHPRLWGEVFAVEAHGSEAVIGKGVIPDSDSTTGTGRLFVE